MPSLSSQQEILITLFFLSSKLEDLFRMVYKPVYLPETEDEKF